MGADMLAVVLPVDDTAMHTAVNNATVSELAEFMHGQDEMEPIWDVFVGSDILEVDGQIPMATIEAELRREPRISNEIRTIMHSTISRGRGRSTVELCVAGIDFVVAGGMSWGDEPYDGWHDDRALAALLDVLGAGVPTG